MKKIIIFLIVQSVSISINVDAQFVNIPDANFRTWLNNNGYASCMNGNFMDTTCALIVNATKVNIQQSNISDITGIQYFDNLDTLIGFLPNITFLPPIHAALLYLKLTSVNKIASIANFPASLLHIEVEINSNVSYLLSVPPLPPGLTFLNCFGWKFHVLPALPSTLTHLECGDNPLYTLPALPAGLTYLNCLLDSLTSLPTLPSTLTYLNCGYNQLTSLPSLPPTLNSLYCYNNQLSSLPSLPSSIAFLSIAWNSISNLPVLPSSLYDFDCRNNYLTSLPVLPNSVSKLNCSNNQLTSLPPYSSFLYELFCDNNFLTSLPTGFPSFLNKLTCSGNQLTTIPVLNPFLSIFNCARNPLTAYPALPAALTDFTCDSVQLNALPLLPSSLDILSCKYCPVTTLPDLPDTLLTLNVSYTPLNCLPYVRRINNFQWTGTNLSCLPNIIQIQSASPSVSSLSLCQPSGNCPTYWNITGNVFKDANANCVKDVSEEDLKLIPVKLDSAGIFVQEFLTNSSGDFSFRTGYGNYIVRIDTTQLPFEVNCPASFSYATTISAFNSNDSLATFGLQCKPGFDLESKSISPDGMIRPGAQRKLYLKAGESATNFATSCAAGISGSVKAILGGPASYYAPAQGAITPTSVSGDTITWNVPDFALVNPEIDFNININISTAANVGDTVCIQLNVIPASGDNYPANNTLTTCYPVVNSLDPNAKEMLPSGAVDTSQHSFTFIIYFQNTGNAPAEDVYILDTLRSDLDPSSFTFLSSSHDVITQMLPGNVLRFNYPDINLPDSISNEPASHGYVQFNLNRKAGLPVGTVISNTAYIYFDYNPAVITNTVSATLTIPVGLNEPYMDNSLLIYPNPATGRFNISFGKPIVQGIIEIQNLFGEHIYIENIYNKSEMEIILKNICNGIYLLIVFDGEKYHYSKLVVEQD